MKRLITATALVLLFGGTAFADQLLVTRVDEARLRAGDGPSRGLVMDTVRERYGDPERIASAVGEPPITRWVYGDFTVYFEHDRVIHSVARR